MNPDLSRRLATALMWPPLRGIDAAHRRQFVERWEKFKTFEDLPQADQEIVKACEASALSFRTDPEAYEKTQEAKMAESTTLKQGYWPER